MCAQRKEFCRRIRPQHRFFVFHHHPLKSPFCPPKSLPNMTDLECFSEILYLTSQIRAMLPPLPRISQTAPRPTRFFPLSLESPNQLTLSHELSGHGVNGSYHEALIKLFLGHLNELHIGCQAQYERVFAIRRLMIRRSEICSSMYSPHDHERCGTCFLKRLASTLKGGLLPLNPTMMMSPTKELPSRLVADTTPKQSESWSRPLNIHQISPQPRSSDFQRSLDSSQSKSLYG